jgi:hypothetical protein
VRCIVFIPLQQVPDVPATLDHSASRIDTDAPCGHCGYNLRGLQPGRTCPECGRPIPLDLRPHDALAAGSMRQRRLLMWGLTIIGLCAAALVALRIGFGVTWATTRGAVPLWPFIAGCAALSLAWVCGVWLAAPRRLDAIRPGRVWLGLLARWTQLLWLPAIACWLLADTAFSATPREETLLFWSSVMAWLAKGGMLAVGLLLWQMAEDAELEDCARRLGMALYVVPVLTAVLTFAPYRAWFFLLAIISPLPLAWGWYMLQFAMASWSMAHSVRWGVRAGAKAGLPRSGPSSIARPRRRCVCSRRRRTRRPRGRRRAERKDERRAVADAQLSRISPMRM